MSEGILVLDAQGTLVPLAADQVTIGPDTLYVQRFKMGWGADGAYADLDEKPATDSKLDAILAAVQALVTDAQLRATALPVSAPTTDAALDAIANLLALIADLQPRLVSNGRAAVAIESGSVGISPSQTLGEVTTLRQVGGQYVNGHALNAAGLVQLYNQIEIS